MNYACAVQALAPLLAELLPQAQALVNGFKDKAPGGLLEGLSFVLPGTNALRHRGN